VNAIMTKLNAASRTQATAIALARGLVPQRPVFSPAHAPRVASLEAMTMPP
jgi:hypothetical protein